MGYSFYKPAADRPAMTVPRMVEFLGPTVEKCRRMSQKVGKPLLFTEAGCMARKNATLKPADWQEAGQYDGQEQAKWLEAVWTAFRPGPWWRGLYWWKCDQHMDRPQYRTDPGGAPPSATALPAWMEEPRRILPDRSQGLAGLVGPFLWGRAADLGAEVRFSDETGAPKADGDCLWLYQFKRGGRTNPETLQLHERNNLTSRDPAVAYEFQPCRVVTNSTQGYQVMKLIVGYVGKDHVFQHGDNTDLVHLANTPRVCVFVPIRRKSDARSFDQDQYVIDEKHDQAPFGVFELAAGETMASGPNYREVAQKRVLLDLRETLARMGPISPGVQKPRFRFTIEGGGKWTLKVEPDGRDGLKGGTDPGGWDLVFTQSSPGARPYTVDLDPQSSKWALSIFNPGGMEESSEVVVGLMPFDRPSGRPVPWPRRDERVRTGKAEQLDKAGGR
jgi:hypothetical protein